ncbi:uncharacterized protein PHALS_13322 [Plasmopara halstedii]|uniref:Uncharacterized protein n=1 Tax=Plasmopara halstedii TaxID=4781 RepID=A0A0P1APP4_PLAHL|nr:uncharacterized protein PHALS_13322 [Plasmopara halstedii]CEG43104.1 hypothetical protein PHALS_13322 [Plasmopara halstedii]|eukprot:XP_024579473.1 hypothetical protein PHALS_13322 [Plasmopara halstedii]
MEQDMLAHLYNLISKLSWRHSAFFAPLDGWTGVLLSWLGGANLTRLVLELPEISSLHRMHIFVRGLVTWTLLALTKYSSGA